MKLIIEGLEVDGQTVKAEFDFANANTRALIKALVKYPDILKCAAANLAHYEANGGLGGQPDVQVTADVDKVLLKFMKK